MDSLINLLSIKDLTSDEIQMRFQDIAKVLMGDYVIKKGNKDYAIVEIEFYLYSPKHRDLITYPRKMKPGRWFFHQSGVDLTFESQGVEVTIENKKETYNAKDATFGGILIRGLYDLDNDNNGKEVDRYIFGPINCVNLLWDDFDAFPNSGAEYPILIKDSERINLINLVKCKRCINIKGDKRDKVCKWAERIGINRDEFTKEIDTYCEELFTDDDKYLYRFFNLITECNPITVKKILPAAARPKLTFDVIR
ncbi:MAG: hypothetical protein K2N28_06070 [Muribaculaceae bacterium]|nr:hypothetical protein [Muribaculaceae bacterium]